MKSRDAGFILVLVAAAAIIATAVFMLLIQPAMTATSEAQALAQESKDFNDTLELRLAQYEADFAKLPETREQIATIQEAFAPQEDIPAVRRAIDEILGSESLTLRNDNYGLPLLVTPGTVFLEPSAQAVGRTSYVDGLTFQDLYSTTINLEFSGQYDNIVRAIAKMQMGEGRYLLVRSMEMRSNDEAADGTLIATLELVFFTLVDPTHKIDPGTNSADFDPETGEPVPTSPPGSALSGAAVPVAPSPTPSPEGEDEADAGSEG